MAMIVFSRAKGQVISFSDPGAPAQASIKLEKWGGFNTLKSLITRVGVGGQCNYQFLHTLGGDIFLYSFGDRIGRLIVSGLSFDNSCLGGGELLGIEQVIRYYNANRLAVRRAPIKLTIGAATTLKGYLDSVSADAVDPVSRIWEFSFHIALVPDPIKKIAGGNGNSGGDAENANNSNSGSNGNSVGNEGSQNQPFSGPSSFAGSMDAGGSHMAAEASSQVSSPGYADFGAGPKTSMVSAHSVAGAL